MIAPLRYAGAAAAVAMTATAASAITVPPGDQLSIQIEGDYATTDGELLGAGSTLMLTNITVSGAEFLFGGDLGTLAVGDSVTDFSISFVDADNVGEMFTIDPGDSDLDFEITSTVLSDTTEFVNVVQGFGLFEDQDASWSFAIAGNLSSADFTAFLQIPPDPTIGEVPLPAGLPLLAAGVAGLALVRRKL